MIHVGLVELVDSAQIRTVEGNAVARRSYLREDPAIACYCRVP